MAIFTVPLALGLALLPAVVLSSYFFWRCRAYLSLELLGEALSLGVIAAMLAMGFGLLGTAVAEQVTAIEFASFVDAFLGAAIPEEIAKFVLVWWIIRRHEDCEHPQSLFVTTIMVGLGFAALENILYVFDDANKWLGIGLLRAVMAVPLHTACGIVMGCFLALAHEYPRRRFALLIGGILVPIIIHGFYDWPLMYLARIDEVPAQDRDAMRLAGNLMSLSAVTLAAIAAIWATGYDRAIWRAAADADQPTKLQRIIGLGYVVTGAVFAVAGAGTLLGVLVLSSYLPDAGFDLVVLGLQPLGFGAIMVRDTRRLRMKP